MHVPSSSLAHTTSAPSDATPYRHCPPSPPRPAHRLEAEPTTTTRRNEAIARAPHMCTRPLTSTRHSLSLTPRDLRSSEYAPSAPAAMSCRSQHAAARLSTSSVPRATPICCEPTLASRSYGRLGDMHVQARYRCSKHPQDGCSGARIA
ncbi:hypothetical protein HYPSUDRAFT_200831 [Hypholoma sublateritium FD-334 SS-4]|uniref:Uncharacterized protein n=1 Tax=Hypholoma sublateritium (strain FD-334 SS-4) TaxID=945553 RepID=A0A0D2MJX6_HYPSF|nr:hypothetical protein HYPSUDRAFT_200831 [Hypholoma sublateritium FD-334 SS-4]